MPFATLTTFIINLTKKSLQVELGSFFGVLNKPDATKQAFSKARKKLSAQVFDLLNKKLVTEFYSDNEIKTFKGLRVLAVDGSTLRLPNKKELAEKYGCHTNNNMPTIPLARTSILFDVLNQITIHAVLHSFRTSEKVMAIEHIQELAKLDSQIKDQFEDLLVFDRGYPSAFLISFLSHHKKQFLMRCNGRFIGGVREAVKSGLQDTVITIRTFRDRRPTPDFQRYLPHLKSDDTMQIRVLVFNLPNGNQEILLTSLLDQKQFTYNDIFMLYGKRWNVEENYKFYKHIAEIENFSGESTLAIEQDFYATVLTCNMASLLMQEAQDEINEKHENGTRKFEYKINRCVAIGTMKNEIIEMLLGDHDLDAYCANLKERMKKSLIPIRPGRSYQRSARLQRKMPSIHRSPL